MQLNTIPVKGPLDPSKVQKTFSMPLAFRTALASIHLVIQSLTLLISTTATPIANTTTPIHTLPSNNIGTQCTEARTWVANGFYRRDCLAITNYIYNNEVRPRESERFEFTSLSATTTRTDLPKKMTPRMYEYGTCVVTIAMMDRFQPRELPGSDFRERYEETDVATFDAMWHAAMKVDFECVRHGKAGWVAAGE